MKVAIIGASGFLGTEMTEIFSLNHHTVFAYDLKKNHTLPDGVIFQQLDILKDPVAFPEPVDAVFYLAQSPFYKEFPKHADHLFGVNSFGAIKAATEALNKHARFFCYTSSGNVYQPCFHPMKETHPLNRTSSYGLSKILAEDSLKLFNTDTMHCMSVRLFQLFGPGQKSMLPVYLKEAITNDQTLYLDPAEDETHPVNGLEISFSFCPDIAQCLLQITLKALGGAPLPSTLNLASHEPVSIRRFAETMGKYLGKKPDFSITNRYRSYNLIADTASLKKLINPDFTYFEKAMEITCR